MKKSEVSLGMIMSCKTPVPAYYSGYPKGSPFCTFAPGNLGIVAALDVPAVVTHHGRAHSYVCVDFLKSGVVSNAAYGGGLWRVGLRYDNLVHRKDYPVLKRFQAFSYADQLSICCQYMEHSWQLQFLPEGMMYRPMKRETRTFIDTMYPSFWVPQSFEDMIGTLQNYGFVRLAAETGEEDD